MLRITSQLLRWQPAESTGWATGAAAAAASAVCAQRQGEHEARPNGADFFRRAANFKKRLRYKSQYAFAREEAQRFLDAEVPKVELSTWMDTGDNALALSQFLNLFEIQPEASVASLLMNKLIRQAEDSSNKAVNRLLAALSLVNIRPEENYERVFQVVLQVLQQLQSVPPITQDINALQGDVSASKDTLRRFNELWDPLASCAKLLQRCGRRVSPAMNDELANTVMKHLQMTPPGNLSFLQTSLVRIYAWMVRAERPESNQVLYLLVECTGEFRRDNFTPLALACVRHNQLVPLPIELIERLTRAAFHYAMTVNAMEANGILSSLAKLLLSVTPNVNGATTDDLYRVRDYYSALLEDFSARVVRFLDPRDILYSSNAEDVSAIVFAYELGGHMRYRRVFVAYGEYVQHEVQTFEPPQLALATGILRRAQLLTPELAARLSERIEVVLGELRLVELSHICATFAMLPGPKPTWWAEAKAVALRLHVPDASGVVRLNLAIAFPDEPNLVETVDYALLTSKQLVDMLPITLGSTQFEEPVVSTLCARLAAPGERFTPDDLQFVLSCGHPALLQAAQAHLRRVFAEPQWNTDILFSLPLVCDAHHPERNQQTFSVAKALAAAKAASVGPLQFLSLAELLLTTFGDGDAAIRQFVQVGGEDIVRSDRMTLSAVVRYLSVLRRYPAVVLSTEWLRNFTDCVDSGPPFTKSELEDLLISLRSLYEDVAKTPALQTLLSLLVEKSYTKLAEADEQTARITVLLVYLQSGMTLPLLTSQYPLLAKVTSNDANFSPQVRKALAMMPLPKPAPAEERRGRFVLKHIDKSHARNDGPHFALDLNTSDPFEVTMDARATPAAESAQAPPPAPPQRQSEPPAPAAAAAAATTVPSPDPYRPPPPPESAAPATEAAAAAAEKPVSYYAKFFNSSVGQIFAGRGTHGEAKDEKARATTAAAGAAPQPRRTRLHPSAAATAVPAETPSTTAAPLSPSAPASVPPPSSAAVTAAAAAPSAVPVTTFTTAWGPTPSSSSMAGWPFAANALQSPSFASSSTAAAVTAEQQHNTAFSSLFGSVPPTPANTATATTAAMAAAPASIVNPSANSTARRAGMGGNNVFFDPSNPSAQRGRPVISRKAVMTRQGAANPSSANLAYSSSSSAPQGGGATAEQDDIRRIYNDSYRATEVNANMGGAGGPQIVLDARAVPAAAAASSVLNGEDSGTNGYSSSGISRQIRHGNVSGMAQFMQKTGVTKISGYNMDDEAANAAAEEPAAAPTGENRPALDWMDAARRVARVTRHPRSKTKSRTHTSLSAWLSTPSARLDATPGDAEGAAGGNAKSEKTAAAADDSAKSGARQTTVAAALHRRRSKKDKAAAVAAKAAAKAVAEATEAAATAHGRRGGGGGGRGKAGKAGKAGKTTKTSKPTRSAAAAAKKKPQAKKAAARPAAAKAATGGRARKTASPPAAKPSVRSAKRTVKAAVKKAAPAKRKPAAGRGKK
ncbi:putative mitochondrial hypothetical protein [Leptomonas pyrrhocoris]|uniref:Uncharacterized protein n=1 Tax=Leptomonas pyrrhocoris TaxID=157538 RepID=A0A0M9G0K0_LEPPY|nr:putative mitochondrial hypothetical protein [Leptomonas pyrrhocoris]KPA79717.1 putative mitochondrial hypothetical protein [Leptomonas pyrrhocoris]|eukprot:XP_015658156.1 putative mitochondrial hypothetical protein [Leptomonas pyrrhocoris]